jgi:hypothetical protein
MSAPHRWARRAMLSMLAGGGLSAAGFGGPLAGGALAAEGQSGTTTSEDQTPAVTETTPQASAPTQAGGSGNGASGAAGTSGAGGNGTGETSGASGTGSNTTSTTPAAPPPSTSTAPAAAAPAASEAAGPTVVVQRSQQTTPGVRHGASVTGSGKSKAGTGNGSSKEGEGAKGKGEGAGKGGPTTVPAGTPNGVAPAPQTAGEEAGALATLLAGSTVSAQALDFYRIPLFLLPVYQAAAFQYDVPWQVLAGINEIETDYGTDLSVSSAGALGWMQFMPGTWLQYGVDATDAGYADPYNPVDAIFAAARYLHAAGASHHLRAAIFSYNHSQEYVESVLLRARLIASYPSSVIATLTGLVDGRAPTAGARLAPGAKAVLEAQAAGMVAGGGASGEGSAGGSAGAAGRSSNATAGAVPAGLPPTPAAAGAQAGSGTQQGAAGTAGALGAASGSAGNTAAGTRQTAHAAADPAATPGSTPAPSPRVAAERAQAAANAPAKPSQLVELLGDPGAPVVAVEDGRIEHLGHSHALGRYLVLRDIYGDLFTYAGLGNIAPRYHPSAPSVKPRIAASREEPKPTQAATAGHQSPLTLKVKAHAAQALVPASAPAESEGETAPAGMGRVRLFAHPDNPVARAAAHSQRTASASGGWAALKTGSIVSKGTVLGHLDTPPGASAGQLRFAVRPAGDSTTIDPQPLLQNWRQLDAALHPKGSKGTDALLGATAGDALSMSKGELERAVLADTGIQLDTCGRRDVAGGTVDKRVLAALLFLSRNGLQPTVSGLRCPRGGDTASGLSVVTGAGVGASAGAALRSAAQQTAAHGGGLAVDITAINNIPIAGHQGSGSVTDAAIRALLTLHGRFAPRRIVSLMKYPAASSTEALPTAWNHIHLEFLPVRATAAAHVAATGPAAASPLAASGALDEAQWSQLIGRIAALPKPKVSVTPSSAAIRDPQAAPTNRGLGAAG